MDKTLYKNQYPVVFIHGFLGIAPEAGFSKFYKYFGSFTKDLIKDLNKDGYEVYQPGLGPFTCAWDRCCEIWAYLYGGTVDYGKVHAERFGHARFGRTYPGVLKDLGTEGKHAKMHIIGHSFGGPTVCMFSSLLKTGSQEELDATPAEEVSEFFKGGHEDLLASVTTLSGTQNGTSLIDIMGDTVVELAVRGVLSMNAMVGRTKFMKFLDLYTDQWGIMDDPATITENKFGIDEEAKKGIDAYAKCFIGNIGHEMGPKASREMLKDMVTLPNTYYFARPASRAHKTKNGNFMPNHCIDVMFAPTTALMGIYSNKNMAIEGDDWKDNDGMVPIAGQLAPEGQPAKTYVGGMKYEKGIWHNMPVVNKDHQTWAGMFTAKEYYLIEFEQMLDELLCLEDV